MEPVAWGETQAADGLPGGARSSVDVAARLRGMWT
jgi:hypothetical protein